ncbi:MAG: hypothetical protein LBT02_00675 [Rickettsiales bacterium]|jgi:hypothetical protein|nr:hypothetical protein [Rickettsiales bacterium]
MKQLSVFLENEPNTLYKLVELLAKNNINLRTINIAETKEFGVARLIVDKVDTAIIALRAGNYACKETEVLAIEVPDVIGGLSKVIGCFNKSDLNIEYMYSILEKVKGNAVMIMKFKDIAKAKELAKKEGIGIYEGGIE